MPADAASQLLQEQLAEVLKTLTPREEKVIACASAWRMAIRTLEEVGSEFGVTRERIRQIEARPCEAPPPQPQQETEGFPGLIDK